MAQDYTLSDGITIHGSDKNASGYKNVSFSPAWTDPNNPQARAKKPFIGTISRDWVQAQDPRAEDYLSGGGSFHLGSFDDPRQAAYAVEKFKSNVKGYLDRWFRSPENNRSFGLWNYPPDLMKLPTVTVDQALQRRQGNTAMSKPDPAQEKSRLSAMELFNQVKDDPEIAGFINNMTSSGRNQFLAQVRDAAMKGEITDQTMGRFKDLARRAAGQLTESQDLDRIRQLIQY